MRRWQRSSENMVNYKNEILGNSKNIFFFFTLMRVLGFFPYTWKTKKQRNSAKLDETRVSISLKNSLGWNVWSLLLLIGCLLLMIVDIISSINEPRGKIVGMKTAEVAQLINDVVSAITVSLTLVICRIQRSMVAEYFMYFARKNAPFPSWTADVTALFIFIMFICAPLNCFMYAGYVFKSYSVISKITMSAKLIVGFYITALVAISYRCNVIHVAKNMEEAFERYLLTPVELNHFNDVDDTDSTIFVFKETHRIPNTVDSSSGASELKKKLYPESKCQNSIFMNTKKDIVHCHQLHAYTNKYLEKLMPLAVFTLIIWILVSSFFILMWSELTLEGQLLSVIHLTEATIPLFFILNSAHILRQKVGLHVTNMQLVWIRTKILLTSDVHCLFDFIVNN